jgi:hypothetical protein
VLKAIKTRFWFESFFYNTTVHFAVVRKSTAMLRHSFTVVLKKVSTVSALARTPFGCFSVGIKSVFFVASCCDCVLFLKYF